MNITLRKMAVIAIAVVIMVCNVDVMHVYAATKLTKPTIKRKISTESLVTFTWKKVKKASKYQIQQKVKGEWTKTWTRKKTKFQKKAKANTKYTFRVRAIKGKKKSKWTKVTIKSLKLKEDSKVPPIDTKEPTTDPTDEPTTEDGGTPEFARPTDRYTYEASVVNPEKSKIYTSSELRATISSSNNEGILPIYIKTNDDYDTDYTDFELVLYKSSNVPSIGTIKTVSELDKENLGESREYGCQFDDVEYIADDTATVNGGYLLGVTTPKTGTYKVAVAVKDTKNYNKYKIVAVTKSFIVNNFNTLYESELQFIINGTEDMYGTFDNLSEYEIAYNIAKFIRYDEHYYYTRRGNYFDLTLIKKSIVPEIVNKQLVCATATELEINVLKKIGISATERVTNPGMSNAHSTVQLSDGQWVDPTPLKKGGSTDLDTAMVL